MDMSMNQYILNPAMKSNAVLNATARELIKKNYQHKFDNLMLRENGKVDYYLFLEAEKNIYWVYLKVPSEVVPKFYYDVIFKFTPSSNTGYFDDIFKYNMKVYSNDPNFVFTFAYVFNKNGLFLTELTSKMSKDALTKAPEEKNPTEQISYEKAIYFAYLIMKNRGINKLGRFKAECKPLDVKFLLKNVMHADEKVELRQEEGKKYSKSKKKNVISQTAYKAMMNNISAKDRRNMDLSASKVKVAATTKSVPTKLKKVNTIKTTKVSPKK